jgi:hypothetical protein
VNTRQSASAPEKANRASGWQDDDGRPQGRELRPQRRDSLLAAAQQHARDALVRQIQENGRRIAPEEKAQRSPRLVPPASRPAQPCRRRDEYALLDRPLRPWIVIAARPENDAHLRTRLFHTEEQPAGADGFVVRMRRDDENPIRG